MGLAQLARFRRTYNAGDVICRQGEEAHEFFILESGAIGIYCNDQKVAQVDVVGDYIGELGVLLKQKRNATMKCEEPTQCFALPANGLDRLLAANPDVAMKLIISLAQRLDETTGKLHALHAA